MTALQHKVRSQNAVFEHWLVTASKKKNRVYTYFLLLLCPKKVNDDLGYNRKLRRFSDNRSLYPVGYNPPDCIFSAT